MADSSTPFWNLTLPEVGSSRDTWGAKLNNDLSLIDALIGAAMPIGCMVDFAGNFAPYGWLLADGSLHPVASFPKLFQIIGTIYGGDGTTNFAVPDTRGRVIAGVGSTTDTAGLVSGYSLGFKIGYFLQTIQLTHLPASLPVTISSVGDHTHTGATDGQGLHAHNGTTDAQGAHAHSYQQGTLTTTGGIASGSPYNVPTTTGTTSTAGSHAHNITTDSQGFHAHSVGTNPAGGHTHTASIAGGGTRLDVRNPMLAATKIIFCGVPGGDAAGSGTGFHAAAALADAGNELVAKDARIPLFPKPGVYRGATADVSATRWFDMNLMRWRGDQLQPIGGWAALEGIDLDSPGRDMLAWHDNAGHRWLVVGTDTKLWAYSFDTQVLRDITPAGVGGLEAPGAAQGYGFGDYGTDLYGTARDSGDIGVVDVSPVLGDMWSLALYGQDLLILPTQDGTLFRWSPATPDTAPAVVPNAPNANAAVAVTDERAIVLIGAGGDSRMVAWSDLENTDVWAPLVTNLAGSKALETEGLPLNIMRTPSGLLIWTDNDVHLMRYVGPPYAYGVTKIGANCGPVSHRAMTQAGGVTAWMSSQGFWMYDGSLTPMPCDVGDWLFSLINRDLVGRVFAYANSGFNEVWFHWPDEGSQECNRYAAVEFTSGSREWMIGLLDRTAADKRSAMVRPLLSDLSGRVQIHEYGWTDNGTTRVGSVFVETGTVALDQSESERVTIKQIVQDFTGPSDRVGYRFFVWEEPNGPEYDTGTFKVVNDSGRTDIGSGFSCRGLRMRIEGLSDGPFAIGRTRLIARPGGRI